MTNLRGMQPQALISHMPGVSWWATGLAALQALQASAGLTLLSGAQGAVSWGGLGDLALPCVVFILHQASPCMFRVQWQCARVSTDPIT